MNIKVRPIIQVTIMLPILVVLIIGCDNGSTVTGPTVSLSDAAATTKLRDGATIHAILAVDTDANEIGEMVRIDLTNMSALADTIAANTGLALNKLLYSGSGATTANLNSGVNALAVGPDDVILFYFSGHGGRTSRTGTEWPDMYFTRDPKLIGLNLDDVFGRLMGKGSRLLIVMSDTCNNRVDMTQRAAWDRRAALSRTAQGYYTLFIESRAAILSTSSIPGEFSYASAEGSVFTNQFIQSLYQEVSGRTPNWSDLMQSATRPIPDVQQHPQYLMY